MSKRVIWSIILIVMAIGAVLLERGMVGSLIGGFLFVVMLFLWAIPGYSTGSGKQIKKPDWKPLTLAFVGTGLGLLASVTALLVLPPRVFPWVLMAVGIGLLVWFFISRR